MAASRAFVMLNRLITPLRAYNLPRHGSLPAWQSRHITPMSFRHYTTDNEGSTSAASEVKSVDSQPSQAETPPAAEQAVAAPKEAAVSNRFNISNMSDIDADDWIREVEMKRKGAKVKLQEDIESGLAHIKITSNNTIVTMSRLNGNPINWASSGSSGFKGARRSTTYAAQMAGQNAAKVARDKGMKSVRVLFKGIGASRGSVLKGIQAGGLKITAISDVTSVPHNGCRPKKQRRL
eukprot:m.90882 g.90882  ORF g.90882 m.90882 type:complete len:236 (-) comp14885_c0_seq2:1365-2072(-)